MGSLMHCFSHNYRYHNPFYLYFNVRVWVLHAEIVPGPLKESQSGLLVLVTSHPMHSYSRWKLILRNGPILNMFRYIIKLDCCGFDWSNCDINYQYSNFNRYLSWCVMTISLSTRYDLPSHYWYTFFIMINNFSSRLRLLKCIPIWYNMKSLNVVL